MDKLFPLAERPFASARLDPCIGNLLIELQGYRVRRLLFCSRIKRQGKLVGVGMLIGLERRFIFIANLRTASSAIEMALRPVSEIALVESRYGKHQPLRAIETRFRWLFDWTDLGQFLIFGVIRDPVDVVVSLYNFHKHDQFAKNERLYTGRITFDEFLDSWAERNAQELVNQHTNFLTQSGEIGANYVIYYDNLMQGLEFVSRWLGVPSLLKLKRQNASPMHFDRRQLSQSHLDWIKSRFASDFEFIEKFCDRLLLPNERKNWRDRTSGSSSRFANDVTQSTAGVTRQDVIGAYRLFLHREPESEKAIEWHLSARTCSELYERFLTSKEFQMRIHPQPAE